jgi:hypothetical protein
MLSCASASASMFGCFAFAALHVSQLESRRARFNQPHCVSTSSGGSDSLASQIICTGSARLTSAGKNSALEMCLRFPPL